MIDVLSTLLEFMNGNLKPEYMWVISAVRVTALFGLSFLIAITTRENNVNPKSRAWAVIVPLCFLWVYYARLLVFGSDSKASGWLILLHGSLAWCFLGAAIVIRRTQEQRAKLLRLVKQANTRYAKNKPGGPKG